MGHNKNYSKFSKHSDKKETNEVLEGQVSIDEIINEPETTTIDQVETETINYVKGIVVGCDKLYVRTKPSKESEPLCTIDKLSEVEVDMINSTEDFYCICTGSGIEGYCMKKFISVE